MNERKFGIDLTNINQKDLKLIERKKKLEEWRKEKNQQKLVFLIFI